MKPFILSIAFLCSCLSFSQKIDLKNAPMNPIAIKYSLDQLNIPKGVFASGTAIFDSNGYLLSEEIEVGRGRKTYLYENGRPVMDSYGESYIYNSDGYLVEKTYAFDGIQKTTYTYNNLGLLIAKKDTYSYSTEYEYDNKNRLIKSINGNTIYEYTYKINGDELHVFEKNLDKSSKIKETQYTYKNGDLIAWNGKPYETSSSYTYYKDILNQKNEFSVIYTKKQLSFSPIDDCKFYLNNQEIKFLFTKIINKTDLIIYNPIEKKYFIIYNAITTDKDQQKQLFSEVFFNSSSYIDYSKSYLTLNYQGVDILNSLFLKIGSLTTLALEKMVVAYDRSLNKNWYCYKDNSIIKHQLVPFYEFDTKDPIIGIRSETKNAVFFKGQGLDFKNLTYGYNNDDVIVLKNNQPTYYIPNYRKAMKNEAYSGRLFNSKTDKILEYDKEIIFRNSTQKNQTTTTNSQSSQQPSTQSTTSTSPTLNCISGNCINDYGKITAENTLKEGFFTNSKLNGYGYLKNDNGFYQGEFKEDVYDGFGFYFLNLTKEFFIGQWRNGNKNGFGYYKVANQITEVGYYQDGKLTTNYMTDDFKNIAYRGNCSGNCVSGFGHIKYSNGDRYTGFFSNSSPAQMGTYYWKNGDWYMGSWENGKRTGQGRLYFTSPKTTYVGNFENDKMEGLGVYMTENGTITQKGIWANGSLKNSSTIGYKTNTIKSTTTSTRPISISNLAKEIVKSYDMDSSQKKSNFKKFILDQEDKWKNEGKTSDQIGENHASLIKELYNNDLQEYSFQIVMKISDMYNGVVLSNLSPEQRLFIKTKSREKIDNYLNKK